MNFTISTDTLNGAVALDSLKEQIEASNITIALSNMVESGDTLTINFKASLSSAEQTELTALVAAHDGVALQEEYVTKYSEVISQGGPRVTDKGFQFTAAAGTTTDYDFQINQDLYVKKGFAIFHDCNFDDKVSMSIVHPITNQTIHYYLEDVPLDIHPAKNDVGIVNAENETITETNFNGLKIRLSYTSVGTTDVKVKVTIRAYS